MCAFHRDANGHLLVDSTPLAEIADRLGTPLYVYSGNGIRDAFTSFASAVAPVAGNIHFALKANSALGVIACWPAMVPVQTSYRVESLTGLWQQASLLPILSFRALVKAVTRSRRR